MRNVFYAISLACCLAMSSFGQQPEPRPTPEGPTPESTIFAVGDYYHAEGREFAAIKDGILGLLDAGINFIDTAPDYGISEERIGKYIASRRGEYYLATKCGCDYRQESDHIEYITPGRKMSCSKTSRPATGDCKPIMVLSDTLTRICTVFPSLALHAPRCNADTLMGVGLPPQCQSAVVSGMSP